MALRPQHITPQLLSKVTKTLGITALDQWYHVSHHAATKAIGVRALNSFGDIVGFLQSAYPHHHFEEERLASKNYEKDQKFIEVIIRQLFPNTEIHTKARKAVGLVNPETDAYLEIDFWIPSLKLGIEYQDKHHYEHQWYANDSLEGYQKRDNLKKDTMAGLGYTLITIGCWWDKTLESVVATIRKFRPDLLQEYDVIGAEPIPSEPPSGYFGEASAIPGVAGIMSPFVPSSNFNPTNWFAGEKLDGVRGIYNPKLNKLFSRSGNELSILSCLVKDIPDILAEGEIIAGRGNYNRTATVSYHSHHGKVNWPMFRYVIFDVPDSEVGDYTQRYSALIQGLRIRPFIFAQLAFRVLIANKAHLEMLLDSIISDTGEGVIMQKDSRYEYGRAKTLAKIKVRRDADAQVLGINKISCTCKLVSGVTAEIIFNDEFDPRELKIGDIISYYHNGHSQSGQPKRGEIYKVRYDLTWEKLVSDDKVQNTIKQKSVKDTIGHSSLITPRAKMGHWNKSSNARAFFDKFARKSGFDPLVAENWYPVMYSSLKTAGGGGLLYAHRFDLKKALSCAYPELVFDTEQFRPSGRKGFWKKQSNIRAFFDEFAKINGFDPLVQENWYQVRSTSLRNAGSGGLLEAYSLVDALSLAYPEMTFEKAKFKQVRHKTAAKRGTWHKPANTRAFFDEFARKSDFDPLIAENWYQVNYRALQTAGGGGLLSSYSMNLQKALSSAYPELRFDKECFRTSYYSTKRVGQGHWKKSENLRTFFDQFARAYEFDPLVAENWNAVGTVDIRQFGGSGILSQCSLQKALSYAYPEMKQDKLKRLVKVKSGHWDKPENVKAFFDKFARKAGFDPLEPENWYPVRTRAVREIKVRVHDASSG